MFKRLVVQSLYNLLILKGLENAVGKFPTDTRVVSPPHALPCHGWADTSGKDFATSDEELMEEDSFGNEGEDEEVDSDTSVGEDEEDESENGVEVKERSKDEEEVVIQYTWELTK